MNGVRKIKVIPPDKIDLPRSTIFEGDTLKVLDIIKSETIQCAITSPPYWGLRDYEIEGQIGLEQSLPEYINKLVTVFREIRRVLKDDGLFWLNIGDGYTSGNRKWRAPDKKNPARAMNVRPDTPVGLKPKDLLSVPWRLALALQEDGWFLRSDIIWNKPNAMPESVKDRPNRSHEYLFMFSKSEQYYYDYEASRETVIGGKRNKRSVWDINTQPFSDAHFATFPTTLIEPCITISTKPGDFVLDPFFGSGTVGVVCQDLDRKYVGIELNPEYISIAHRRLRDHSNSLYRLAG